MSHEQSTTAEVLWSDSSPVPWVESLPQILCVLSVSVWLHVDHIELWMRQQCNALRPQQHLFVVCLVHGLVRQEIHSVWKLWGLWLKREILRNIVMTRLRSAISKASDWFSAINSEVRWWIRCSRWLLSCSNWDLIVRNSSWCWIRTNTSSVWKGFVM